MNGDVVQHDLNKNDLAQSVRNTLLAKCSDTQGSKITRVGLEEHAVELIIGQHFLRIESEWSYFNPAGIKIDSDIETDKRPNFELWKCVGHTVVEIELKDEPFSNLYLTLDNGHKLVVFGNDDDYEDWDFDGFVCMGKI